ncbi:MAG: hypothetical protein AAB802_04755 [Patescibacteria group bacterium]
MTRKKGIERKEREVASMRPQELLGLILDVMETSLPPIRRFSDLLQHLKGKRGLSDEAIIARASHPQVNRGFLGKLIGEHRVPKKLEGNAFASQDSRYKQLAHGLLIPEEHHAAFQRLAEMQQIGWWGISGNKIVNRRAQKLQELGDALNDLNRRIMELVPGEKPEVLDSVHTKTRKYRAEIEALIAPVIIEGEE